MVKELKDYDKEARNIVRTAERLAKEQVSIPITMFGELSEGRDSKEQLLEPVKFERIEQEDIVKVNKILQENLFNKTTVKVIKNRYETERIDEVKPLEATEFKKLVEQESLEQLVEVDQGGITSCDKQAIREVLEDKKGYKKPLSKLMNDVLTKVENYEEGNKQGASEQDHSLSQF